ncbi:hypothetical protein FRX31_027406 [Thalictrum thalictroides]|uniref:Helitron helicase-like domain-containing protein n=1 Tax=Thalictrum thalictroides TaxID=46969 RepID=A0A7J6VD39_THATH|nr:hypothetical protein FRX31_027406 [Thalictrum thalictroides]
MDIDDDNNLNAGPSKEEYNSQMSEGESESDSDMELDETQSKVLIIVLWFKMKAQSITSVISDMDNYPNYQRRTNGIAQTRMDSTDCTDNYSKYQRRTKGIAQIRMDSIEYVFITMAYNPNGPEVENYLKNEDKQNDKDNKTMVDSIFKIQLSKQVAELNKYHGRPFQCIHVHVDHKKGIPQAHILGLIST